MPGRRAAHRSGKELTATASSRAGRLVAIGDPQGPTSRFLAVLAHRGILAGGEHVREDTRLISLGDHFDYPPAGGGTGSDEDVGGDGVHLLSWLAGEPAERVILLLGNHDACRVIEFAGLDDRRFARARDLARELARATAANEGAAADLHRRRFGELFPEIPTPELALRDFSSFTEAQRRLVQELLLADRFRLAHAARLAGLPEVEVLVTHAGITERELALLGMPAERRPVAIARALNAFLDRAVDRVRVLWQAGERVPLDLGPLHVAGTTGAEGGGLLYHRPADPENAAGSGWSFDPGRPRRFDPRRLPRGLVQVCGHTAHDKCAAELARWVAFDAPATTGRDLRILSVRDDEVRYARWDGERPPHDRASASLLLLDASLHRAEPATYPVLELLDDCP